MPKETSSKRKLEKPVKVLAIQAQYKFSDLETVALAREQQRVRAEIKAYEDQLASIKTDFKAKIETAELKVNSLGCRICDGFEMREAQAVVEYDAKTRKKKFWHHDQSAKGQKGEFIREEDMTASDFQPDLIDTPAKEFTNPVLPVPTAEQVKEALQDSAMETAIIETDEAIEKLKE